MLAIRQSHDLPALRLHSGVPVRASIGPKRNPESTSAILEAAESILREEGLAALSMDAIARRARCGKPTLYRWWPDKALLLADIHERALAGLAGPRPRSVDALAPFWLGGWRTTLAGVALRGLVAEAQSCETAMQLLHERALSPYREDLLACERAPGDAPLEDLLASLLGMLLLQREPAALTMPTIARNAASSAPPTSPVSESVVSEPVVPEETVVSPIRHRGEWVD